MALADHKATFIQSALSANALSFGTFTLKSGRTSPYFFNAGLFHRASLFRSISLAYANTLASHTPALDFDVLFGPAYKGIPLAASVLDKLAGLDEKRYGDVSYSFNRKEAKDHGEGGTIVGAGLKGKRVVIIDDVITAGTAIREAIEIIKAQGGTLVGIIVAFDRQEKTPAKEGEDEVAPRGSAIGELSRAYEIPVLSILNLDDVVQYLKTLGTPEDLKRLEEYRERYRATD
ncbi:orotate phosphoribosyltransferase [Pseudovirgaria hyperparasitica]|uniref:Orotate phosphoribosyltransferase n=1 Tax=Pseudovirgaria hyperparasitica TaxID=470096 RepID=A0A6A6WLT6_9PEZI|nr:orotate phosphoribosyltransferase [Pseudovirgaria hyperparasitica]KAF2763180.1 orotate phosphoribosyltransferase [Pseudovirgaria hyperparasitica]